MEILIIILIVLLAINALLSIISNFIERYDSKNLERSTKIWEETQRSWVYERKSFIRTKDLQSRRIEELTLKITSMHTQLEELNKVNGLLQNRLLYIDALKDSFNAQAEGAWTQEVIVSDIAKQTPRLAFVKGMKCGAEWLAHAVGVKVTFEIDGRHSSDYEKNS